MPTSPATKDAILKTKRGRPRVRVMPDLIPDTPENIARAIMQGPPKPEWDFEQELKTKRRPSRA